jgi:hypothetical protein
MAWYLEHSVKHHVGRAFDGDHIPVLMAFIVNGERSSGLRLAHIVDRDHALALRVEGHFVLARVGLVDLDVQRASLGGATSRAPSVGSPTMR